MAKHKQISSDFWADPFIEDLDPIEKLLYLYLITNERNNLIGVYEITLKRIGNETGIDRDMVAKIIGRFADKDKIHYTDKHIIIVNFWKYTSKSPTTIEPKHKLLEELPEAVKEFIVSQSSRVYESVMIGYGYPIDTLWVSFYKSKSKRKSINKNIKQEKENTRGKEEKNGLDFSKFGGCRDVLLEFCNYRKEIKKPIRSQKSLNLLYEKLKDLSGSNLVIAKKIVYNSIANGWQGLFPLNKKPICQHQSALKDHLQSFRDFPDYEEKKPRWSV